MEFSCQITRWPSSCPGFSVAVGYPRAPILHLSSSSAVSKLSCSSNRGQQLAADVSYVLVFTSCKTSSTTPHGRLVLVVGRIHHAGRRLRRCDARLRRRQRRNSWSSRINTRCRR